MPRDEVANAAVLELRRIDIVIDRLFGRRIGMLVMSEMRANLRLLERAIRRRSRKGELERQQEKNEDGEEAAHGSIIYKVSEMPRLAGTARSVMLWSSRTVEHHECEGFDLPR